MTPDLFPRLGNNFRLTSPKTPDYNCIAWSAEDTLHWWQPGGFWPISTSPHDCGIGNLEQALTSIGYEPCQDGSLESGFQKVALYGSALMFTHAARQLPDGSGPASSAKQRTSNTIRRMTSLVVYTAK